MEGLEKAQTAYDRQLPVEYEIDEDAWPENTPGVITPIDVEQWIKEFAESGYVEGFNGLKYARYGSLEHVVAMQWVRDREKLPDAIANAFWRWARDKAYMC